MDHGNETLLLEPLHRHRSLAGTGIGQSPGTLSRTREFACLKRRHPQTPEKAGDGRATLALLEAEAAQSSPNPFIQTLEVEAAGRKAVVGHPANDEQIESDDHLRQTTASGPTGNLPDALLGAGDDVSRVTGWSAFGI